MRFSQFPGLELLFLLSYWPVRVSCIKHSLTREILKAKASLECILLSITKEKEYALWLESGFRGFSQAHCEHYQFFKNAEMETKPGVCYMLAMPSTVSYTFAHGECFISIVVPSDKCLRAAPMEMLCLVRLGRARHVDFTNSWWFCVCAASGCTHVWF